MCRQCYQENKGLVRLFGQFVRYTEPQTCNQVWARDPIEGQNLLNALRLPFGHDRVLAQLRAIYPADDPNAWVAQPLPQGPGPQYIVKLFDARYCIYRRRLETAQLGTNDLSMAEARAEAWSRLGHYARVSTYVDNHTAQDVVSEWGEHPMDLIRRQVAEREAA